MIGDVHAHDGLGFRPVITNVQANVLHAAVPSGSLRFSDDPVTILKAAEGKHAVLIAYDGFHLFHRAGVVQVELHTGQRSASGIDLDAHDLLALIRDRGNRRIAVGVSLVNRHMDYLMTEQISVRRGDFADGVLAVIHADEANQPLRVGNSGHDQLVILVKQADLGTGQRRIVLINLPNQNFGEAVFQRSDRLIGIDKGAVDGDRNLREILQIPGKRLCLLDGVGAIRNLFKCHQPIFIRNSGRLQRTILSAQPTLDTAQRLMERIDFEKGEPGVVIRNGGLFRNLAMLIDGKGHLRRAKLIPFRREYLAKGVCSGNSRKRGQVSIFPGIVTADGFPIAVSDFDQRTR